MFEKTACGLVPKIGVCQVLGNDEHNVTDDDIEFRLAASRAMLQKKVVNADVRRLGRAGRSVVLKAAAEIGRFADIVPRPPFASQPEPIKARHIRRRREQHGAVSIHADSTGSSVRAGKAGCGHRLGYGKAEPRV